MSVALIGCAGTGSSLPDSALGIALRSRVKLAGERPLDRKHGKVLTLDISATLIELTRSPRSPRPYRLVLQTPDRKRPWILFATLSEQAGPIPIEVGEPLTLHYRARFDKKAGLARRALSIRDGNGVLVLVFQDQGLLSREHLPTGLTVEPDSKVVYTEAGPLARLCYTVVEHAGLEIGLGDETRVLAPGVGTQVQIGSDYWLVTAVDNARTLKAGCPDFRPDRVAWFALRTPAPTE